MTKSIGIASLLASPPLGMFGADKFYTGAYIYGISQVVLMLVVIYIFYQFYPVKDIVILIPFGLSLLLSLMAITTLCLYVFAEKETLLYPVVEWEKVSTTDKILSGVSIFITLVVLALVIIFRNKLVEF